MKECCKSCRLAQCKVCQSIWSALSIEKYKAVNNYRKSGRLSTPLPLQFVHNRGVMAFGQSRVYLFMKYFVLTAVLIFSGCATWIPPTVIELEEGTYRLSTTGNSFASREKMELKLEKKARSLCGESGFEYIKKPSVSWGEQKDYSTGMTVSYKVMSTTVKCGTGPLPGQ